MNSESETGQTEDTSSPSVVPREYLVPFILVTTLFALWGFANNFTDPMVKVFKDVFAISNAQSSIVQMAFYGGYATMAIPAAVFIRKYSYKSGILVGLTLFATGALLSIPAAANINFWLFIFGIYILTFGLAFLETTANPFILSMGPEETSTMRLNLAQAFNPIGSLGGAFIAASFVLTNVYVADFKADVTGFKEKAAEFQTTEDELNVSLTYAGTGRLVWRVEIEGGEKIQNQQNSSHNYQTFPIGWVNFPKAGRYTVATRCIDGDIPSASLKAIHFEPIE